MTITKLAHYPNGNYTVELFSDGTKVRETSDDSFRPAYAENIDIKITDYCEVNCPMCHEKSTVSGVHGDLNHPALSTFQPGTELAIGGGNPLAHPDLIPFLEHLRGQGVIANLTVNQVHFLKSVDLLHELTNNGLLHGLGISLVYPSKTLIEKLSTFPNAVLHVINGYHSLQHLEKLYGYDLKLLILGYKHFGRGIEFYSQEVIRKQNELYEAIHAVLRGFQIVSFDNLAFEQLKVRRLLLREAWDAFYMGHDGTFTYYLDAVKEEFALNSFAPVRYPMLPDVGEMFNFLKSCKNLT